MSEEAVATNSELDPKLSELIEPLNALLLESQPVEQNDYEVLFKVAFEALDFVPAKYFPPLYLQSIFGRVGQWIPPHRKDSEYTIIDFWKPLRTLEYLVDLTVPAYSHEPGPWMRTLLPPVVQNVFWRPSNYFQQADPFDGVTSFANEHWFFLNGICTNEAVAKINSDLISRLFQRPVTCIHNATCSIGLDLTQCVVGKIFKTDPDLEHAQSMTEPAIKATLAIIEALKDPNKDKVVLLCHSQGTIITANVLRALQRSIENIYLSVENVNEKPNLNLDLIDQLILDVLLTDDFYGLERSALDTKIINILKKLEVYTFANCADKMNYVTHVNDEDGNKIGLPYIENFANQYDLVARLGVLSPLERTDPSIIEIDGDVYEKQGLDAWGHLLNQHYLFGMEGFLKGNTGNPYQPQNKEEPRSPRLYEYYDGSRPAPYYK